MAAGLAGAAWLDTVLKPGRSTGCALNGAIIGAIVSAVIGAIVGAIIGAVIGAITGALNDTFSSELGDASGLSDDGAIRMPPK